MNPGASFGFEVEIKDYSEGGASLANGTWSLIGAPVPYSNLGTIDRSEDEIAELRIDVAKISNDETYLGSVNFSEDPQYSPENFDTSLAFNDAVVQLSGAAKFPYLNTLRTNRGQLTLTRHNQFTTAGDLTNNGVINVLATETDGPDADGAMLHVTGNLQVEGGRVYVMPSATLRVPNKVSVIGGSLELDPGAVLEGPRIGERGLGLNSRWEIRESWDGVRRSDESDLVRGANVQLGDHRISTIESGGHLIVDGQQVSFPAIDGLAEIQGGGSVDVLGGFELKAATTFTNSGELNVGGGGRLVTMAMDSEGTSLVGAGSYLEAPIGVVVSSGTLVVDGVVRAQSVNVSDPLSMATLTGSGRVTGDLAIDRGLFEPGSPHGSFQTFGDFIQWPGGRTRLEISGDVTSENYDQIIASGAQLDGTLELVFDEGFSPSSGQEWILLELSDASNGEFREIVISGLSNQLPAEEDLPLLVDVSDQLLGSRNDKNVYLSMVGGDGNDWSIYTVSQTGDFVLQAGDADQDLDFDQFDLIQVQQAATYLTGTPATWGEGDWNAAPGGEPGNPPRGDGQFDQRDIVAALQGGFYLKGRYVALQSKEVLDDAKTSIVYDPETGHLVVEPSVGRELTSISLESASGVFTGSESQGLGGTFDNDSDHNIFKATFGGSFGILSLGNVMQPGLSSEFLLNDLTIVGSLAGGGSMGEVDLVLIPEPASALLLWIAGLLVATRYSGRKWIDGLRRAADEG